MTDLDHDLILVGGGLASGLVALSLHHLRPELNVAIVDKEPVIGGNHVWSFFDSDIDPAHRWLVDPLISHRWPGYDVRFPAYGRTFSTGYNSILSDRFDEAVRSVMPDRCLYLSQAVTNVTLDSVALADGRILQAKAVIDGRGAGDFSSLCLGWQKFAGQELVLDKPHGLRLPMIMDATVAQIDGYRFLYLLPFAADRLFVEDTCYSDTPDVDVDAFRSRIADYVSGKGWHILSVTRQETAALPVVMGGDIGRYMESGGIAAKIGLRAGLFHPTTSYSLPDAVRMAIALAAVEQVAPATIAEITGRIAREAWSRRRFYRFLDRMLFRAARPSERYRVMQRFYALEPGLIERFYGVRSTMLDRLRILTGRPPVPVLRAVAALWGGRG